MIFSKKMKNEYFSESPKRIKKKYNIFNGRRKINSVPLEIEEIFLDNLLKKRKDDPQSETRKIESPLEESKFSNFLIFSAFLLLLILGYSFNLQVLNYKKYDELSLRNKFLDLKIKAERGIIYDTNMKQLVFNETSFDLWARTSLPEKTLKKISKITNIPQDQLEEKIAGGLEEWVLLKEALSHQELVFFETETNDLDDIKIKKQIKRNYFEEKGLSHILGYLGKISPDEFKEFGKDYQIQDYVGKEGLERQYESVLAEKKGILEIEKDAKGEEIFQKIKSEPQSGSNLVLNIDIELEKKISEVLERSIKNGQAKAGVIVVLNPENGAVLSSVSLPSFDNNLFAQGISQKELEKLNEDPNNPQLNRALGGVYPVGSTIKPFLGVAGLEEKVITEETNLFCPLDLCLENKYSEELECFSDWKFHGYTSIKKAIAESVNPFFYMLGGGYDAPSSVDIRLPKHFEGLGVLKIESWLKKFGWGEKTGVDLPGEVKGRVPSPDWKEEYFETALSQKWYLGDTYNLSIGQGYILVSPIQVASAFQAIANGGRIFKPKLVKKIDEETVRPEILKEAFIQPESINIIKEGMRQAVSLPSGSAYYLNSLPVKVGAKTGTAETGKEEVYHNWISVFAPYDNPEIVMVIMIEDVQGVQALTQIAAYEILDWYFSNNQL